MSPNLVAHGEVPAGLGYRLFTVPQRSSGRRAGDHPQGEESRRWSSPPPGPIPPPALTADLLAYLDERVAKFKLPCTIDYVAELPRDANGKLYKRRLRDPYWAGRTRVI
jgi:acyl-CoA synthetase (AMP-forming)/AMP-acid ligase II